jgi:hypothetical protein
MASRLIWQLWRQGRLKLPSHLSLLAAHHAKSAAELAAGQDAIHGLPFIHKGMSDS